MFENLMVIAAIIVILWLIGFAVYLYTSRLQQDISTQIDDLKARLDAEGQDAQE